MSFLKISLKIISKIRIYFLFWIVAFVSLLSISSNSEVKSHDMKLFKFEKDYNSQNLMVVYAKVDSDCRFSEMEVGDQKVLVDFYWLMNRHRYKATNASIKQKIYEKLKLASRAEDGRSFSLTFTDLEKMNHDLPTGEIKIEVHPESQTGSLSSGSADSKCQVSTRIELGPRHQNQTMELESIFSEVKTNFFRIPTGIYAIELRGKNIVTGEKVIAHFDVKNE